MTQIANGWMLTPPLSAQVATVVKPFAAPTGACTLHDVHCGLSDKELADILDRGSEERSLLESLSNHVHAKGAAMPSLFGRDA